MKYLQIFSNLFLGMSILFGSWLIADSMKEKEGAPNIRPVNVQMEKDPGYRYDFIAENNQMFIFDRMTGEYWQKFLVQGEGPSSWELQESPSTEITKRKY
ncbi:hypothetical protein LCL89_05170 [Halobacillus yeomjeoni]|uniref:hypothetical protein n=1 Tax=Halobacillus yeomjeoni TaxID=311194 RepID=UPI001CD7245E|nr:hypothetical protein [Halobacillus yeomjeoni]MCA0983442.1 hypothetical protein [Halobacillus yeomjeoni]